jgi:hypothetical protein
MMLGTNHFTQMKIRNEGKINNTLRNTVCLFLLFIGSHNMNLLLQTYIDHGGN